MLLEIVTNTQGEPHTHTRSDERLGRSRASRRSQRSRASRPVSAGLGRSRAVSSGLERSRGPSRALGSGALLPWRVLATLSNRTPGCHEVSPCDDQGSVRRRRAGASLIHSFSSRCTRCTRRWGLCPIRLFTSPCIVSALPPAPPVRISARLNKKGATSASSSARASNRPNKAALTLSLSQSFLSSQQR